MPSRLWPPASSISSRQLLERAPERVARAGGVLEQQRARVGLRERLARAPRRRAPAPRRAARRPSSRGGARRRRRRSRRPSAASASATRSTSRRISVSFEAQLIR